MLRPITVAPSSSLPGMEVQCVGRSSGVQTGQILPALTSVKIYGRMSPSHTYQVTSSTSSADSGDSGVNLGIPGDSGAWVVDRHHGQVCGHVLAWSKRKCVAYICPMDVSLLDVAQTLGAREIRLPGGEPVVILSDLNDASSVTEMESRTDKAGEASCPWKERDNGANESSHQSTDRRPITELSLGCGLTTSGASSHGTSSPIRLETPRAPRCRQQAGGAEPWPTSDDRRFLMSHDDCNLLSM